MSGDVTDLVEAHLREHLSGEPQRASVTFLGVEPIDVLLFAEPVGAGVQATYASVGCSRHPMSDPLDIHADPEAGPRAEVLIRLTVSGPMRGLHRSLATIAAAPSVEGLVLGADALIDLGEPLWDGSVFTAVVLADLEGPDLELPDLDLPGRAEPVHFLRAIPITANEAAWVRLKGVDALRVAWAEAGIDINDPQRAAGTPS
ncbi:suppressor of fused domain protein [Gordonia jinhuaensis]|uniref:Suppressor of fused-like domain-containing protein n=1 Tax=Gordonia jinhuaensis TaxID=1517702 RepID=A0A916SVQ5_9ACTN|nr:suppressor of fused domain protein [Gordonia jinhuaensis]GGB16372.1 hypothetical protein GCM10011489_00570 [Gordonia jinhuaensis]